MVRRMKNEIKTKAQLAAELKTLRRRVAELEKIESHCLRMEERLKRELAERKQAEEIIKASDEKYRLIFNSSNDAMFVHHPTADNMPGIFVEVNDAACRILGRTRKELLKEQPVTIANMKKARYQAKEAMEILARDRHLLTESVFVHRDGTEIPVELNIHLFNFQGRPAVLTIARDINERRKAEEALRESEEKYRSLFDNMLEGFAYCQIVVDENNRPVDFVYLAMNDAFEKLTGYTRRDFIGKRVTEVIPGIRDSKTDFFDIYGRIALAGEEAKFEVYFEPLDKWLRIYAYSPKKGFFGAVFDDITKRKQAEDKLKQDERKIRELAAAYVRAQEEERQWIALEVHDRLVQTLTAAFHQLQTLKSMPQAEPDPIVREVTADAFHLVKDAISETRNIMKELYPETLSKFGLHPLIREELQRLEEETGYAMSFASNCQMRLPKDIETTFYRIFHEALLNVKKHAANASTVTVHLNLNNGKAELMVEDNGAGFNVAAVQGKNKGPGGLESMLRRAEIIGGKVSIDSQPGRGTRISVRIPLLLLTSK